MGGAGVAPPKASSRSAGTALRTASTDSRRGARPCTPSTAASASSCDRAVPVPRAPRPSPATAAPGAATTASPLRGTAAARVRPRRDPPPAPNSLAPQHSPGAGTRPPPSCRIPPPARSGDSWSRQRADEVEVCLWFYASQASVEPPLHTSAKRAMGGGKKGLRRDAPPAGGLLSRVVLQTANSVPKSWRTPFRSGRQSGRYPAGTLSAMPPGRVSAIEPASCPSWAGTRNRRSAVMHGGGDERLVLSRAQLILHGGPTIRHLLRDIPAAGRVRRA